MGHLSTSNRIDASSPITDTQKLQKTVLSNGNGVLNKDIPDKMKDSFDRNNNDNKNIEEDNGIAVNSNGTDKHEIITSKTHLNVYENWKGDELFGIKFKAPLKWDKIFLITFLHVAFVYFGLTYDFPNFSFRTALFAYFCGSYAGFGVTGGAHRLWTHRAYKATLPLRILLIIGFSMSGQNSLYDWVRDHRVHHKYSETDADPHNSNRGFFFAHVGWLMMYKHPEVLRRGRQIDMSDVLADPVVQFHEKYFPILKTLICFIIPTLIPVYCWNETWYTSFVTLCIIRYTFGLNFTWSVNSAAHIWGNRPYDKRINPSENLFVSVIAMGEGWHNYHHVFPWDYKAAELGKYSVNATTFLVDMFAKIGWAYDLKQPSKELVMKVIEKTGDGSHEVYGHHIKEVPMPNSDESYDENSNFCNDKKE